MEILWRVTDGQGYTCADGLSVDEARRIGRAAANRRGEMVTVTPYTTDDEGIVTDDLDAEYTLLPEAITTIQSRTKSGKSGGR